MKTKYRVGTLSVGLLFITLGVGLLLQHWIDFSFTSLLFTWWPILMILLGAEILITLRFLKKESEARVGYDLFSIFIILMFTVVSLFLYTVKESGFLGYVQSSILTNGYNLSTAPEIIDDLNGIRKVVVSGQAKHIQLRSQNSDEPKVSIQSDWKHVPGETLEEATQRVSDLVESKIEGDTLYLSFSQPAYQTSFREHIDGVFYLELPEHLELQANVREARISVEADSLRANWNIQSEYGSVDIWSPSEVKYNILARTQNGHINVSDQWDTLNEEQNYASIAKEDSPFTLQLTTRNGWINLIQ